MTSVTRAELLGTASMKLAEVVLLLMEAGEASGWRSRGTGAAGGDQCADFSSHHLHIALSGAAGAKVPRPQFSKSAWRPKRA